MVSSHAMVVLLFCNNIKYLYKIFVIFLCSLIINRNFALSMCYYLLTMVDIF